MLLSGFQGLSESDQDAVLEHCMKKENWAKLVKPKTMEITAVALELKENDETAVVPLGHKSERETFVIPEPGKDGAIPNALAGKVFVISGTFPEVITIWLNIPTRSNCCETCSLPLMSCFDILDWRWMRLGSRKGTRQGHDRSLWRTGCFCHFGQNYAPHSWKGARRE